MDDSNVFVIIDCTSLIDDIFRQFGETRPQNVNNKCFIRKLHPLPKSSRPVVGNIVLGFHKSHCLPLTNWDQENDGNVVRDRPRLDKNERVRLDVFDHRRDMMVRKHRRRQHNMTVPVSQIRPDRIESLPIEINIEHRWLSHTIFLPFVAHKHRDILVIQSIRFNLQSLLCWVSLLQFEII